MITIYCYGGSTLLIFIVANLLLFLYHQFKFITQTSVQMKEARTGLGAAHCFKNVLGTWGHSRCG